MIGLVISGFAAIIATAYSIRFKNKLCIAIVMMQIITIALPFVGLGTQAYGLHLFSLALILLYPFMNEDGSAIDKILVSLFILPSILMEALNIARLPWEKEYFISFLIPTAIFIFALIKREKYTVEIGFMIMVMASLIIKLLEAFL